MVDLIWQLFSSGIVFQISVDSLFFYLEIIDNGPGFSNTIISKVGNFELTYGKIDGNGIGLFNFFNFVKKIDGQIKICNLNSPCTGARIEIKLPRKIFFILIDDDELVRMVWDSKAKDKKINFKSFSDPSEVDFALLDKKTVIYLDSDLKSGLRGEDLAIDLNLKGFKNLYLATGHDSSSFQKYTFLKGVIGKTPPWA